MLVGEDSFEDEDLFPFRVCMGGKAAMRVIADQTRDRSRFAALAVKGLAPHRPTGTCLPLTSGRIDSDNNRYIGIDIGRGALHLRRSLEAFHGHVSGHILHSREPMGQIGIGSSDILPWATAARVRAMQRKHRRQRIAPTPIAPVCKSAWFRVGPPAGLRRLRGLGPQIAQRVSEAEDD